ncbi:hypothetical protein D8M04_05500 [Oceanobacillus piezotolerans]|uniref:Flagellar protein n=1 Tax=Oceanobacillus piezotolerans TaxID=2448030 RepID=A0A498DFF5_9BACI|nr:TIGR03826 family flagellar region protein [Oceanobacillus piezotolerans]RLL46661.1 hypothetical protein D8M04_05500 [Oceanobacillus piezotolerans]
MAELANCSRCGSVFLKGVRDICPDCYKEEEEAFQTVHDFLIKQKNRQANMLQIVEDTGVEESFITKFIKEKRLLISQFPNLAYSCERCGNDITSGKICASCQAELTKELQDYEEIEDRLQSMKDKEKVSSNTYYFIGKDRKN